MVMEASAETHISGSQALPSGAKAVMKMRRNTANAAALGPADRNALTGVGAPSYTSGAHIWKGAAETLNPNPTNINPAAAPSSIPSVVPEVASRTCTVVRLMVPVQPYTTATP